MMRSLAAVSLAPLFALACLPAPPDLDAAIDQRVEIPAAPAAGAGFQLIGPEITIPAGGDQMWCWVPDLAPDTVDHLVKDFVTFQGRSGHHLLAMKSVVPRQPNDVFDCTSVEGMSSVEPLMSPSTQNSEGTVNLLSDDFAVRVPAGTQIVMQSHYVNVETKPILVRDVGNFIFLPPEETRIEANYMVINDLNLQIPPNNQPYTHATDCVLEQPMQFAALTGHMHEWGKRVFIEKINAEGSTTIYDVPAWSPKFRDAPPVTHLPLAAPITVAQGETLRVTCEWVNDTDEALTFPHEMCDAVFVYYPALPEGFLLCGE